jgi:phospholipid/cholesterol/gamma-HCH transport system permease protein
VAAILERLGASLIGMLEQLGLLTRFALASLVAAVRPPYDGAELARQMVRVGVDAFPVVLLTSIFTGMVLTLQTYQGFERFGATSFVGTVVSISIIRELAPVLMALMLTGRSGSAIAAEIGTMRVTEQIDALVAMSIDPVKYLFVPRLLAGLIMVPVLVLCADAIAIIGGRAVAVGMLHSNPVEYDLSTFRNLELSDIFSSVLKALVFGLILVLVACVYGYHARGGSEGVGRSTTRAVVTSSAAILIADFFLTKILF